MGRLIFFIVGGIIIFNIIFYIIKDKAKKIYYTEWYKEGKPCLSFEEFISFYNINPGRWKVEEEWDSTNYEMYNILTYFAKGEKLIFSWKTDRDRIDYLEWAKNKERQERDIKTAKILAKLTKNVREDIKFYNEKAQNEAQETYDYILKMMEEE